MKEGKKIKIKQAKERKKKELEYMCDEEECFGLQRKERIEIKLEN